jgi:hypothetical protein
MVVRRERNPLKSDFRFQPDHMVQAARTAAPPQRRQAEAHALGSVMRIVSSPWEGIYLEQANSFLSGCPEMSSQGS